MSAESAKEFIDANALVLETEYLVNAGYTTE